MTPILCLNCGGQHFARDCPEPDKRWNGNGKLKGEGKGKGQNETKGKRKHPEREGRSRKGKVLAFPSSSFLVDDPASHSTKMKFPLVSPSMPFLFLVSHSVFLLFRRSSVLADDLASHIPISPFHFFCLFSLLSL